MSSRSLNKVILIGNLGADPEVRSTNNGTRVATLSVATSRQWNGQGGDKQEKTEWHKVILWNNSRGTGLADIAEKFCKKGDKVYVEGRIEYRSWQDREGQTRYTTEIVASDIILLGGDEGLEQGPSRTGPGGSHRGGGRSQEGGQGRLRRLPRGLGRRGRRPAILRPGHPPVRSAGGWLRPSLKARGSRHAAKDPTPPNAVPRFSLMWVNG